MSVICLSAVLRRLTVFMLLHCYVKIESPSTCFRIVKVDMHLLFSTASCAVFCFVLLLLLLLISFGTYSVYIVFMHAYIMPYSRDVFLF